jgi:hypothetical protein
MNKKNTAKVIMIEYVGFLRMMELWFHGAHHLTKGKSFAGDHVNIYGKIYETVDGQLDSAIEKSMALFGDDCANPLILAKKAVEIMEEYPNPAELKSQSQAAIGLQIEKDFLVFSQKIYNLLKKMGAMTLGLDDMIMANANAHETHVYLLQQRIRSEID